MDLDLVLVGGAHELFVGDDAGQDERRHVRLAPAPPTAVPSIPLGRHPCSALPSPRPALNPRPDPYPRPGPHRHSYQVVGHTKTIIIWLLGVLVFTSTVTTNSVIGFVIAMVGVVWYTQLRMNESPAKPPAPAGSTAPPAYPSDATAVHIPADKVRCAARAGYDELTGAHHGP